MDTKAFRFIQAVQLFIEKLNIQLEHKRILIAVSGGIDSCVLLDALLHVKKNLHFDVGVCHVNHGLRGKDSNRDEKFVIQLTKDYNVQLTVRRFETEDIQKVNAGNLEGEARNLRYRLLAHTAEELGYDYIATGHTKSDQAETVLHRMLRSSGLSGLSGILPICEQYGETVIRPMLCHTRDHVDEYARIMNLSFQHDEMNDDYKYTRVKIRHELLPALKETYNPKMEDSLSQLALICRDEEQFWIQHLKTIQKRIGDGTKETPAKRSLFVSLNRAEQRRCLHAWFAKSGIDPNGKQIENAIDLISSSKPQGELHLSKEIYLYCRYDIFFMTPEINDVSEVQPEILVLPGNTKLHSLSLEISAAIFPKGVIKMEKKGKWYARLNYDRIEGDLNIRTWIEGDQIQPMGMKGHKKLSALFQEHRIPIEKRHTLPLFCHHNDIIWVPGCCVSEKYKVCSTTNSVLELTIQPILSILSAR